MSPAHVNVGVDRRDFFRVPIVGIQPRQLAPVFVIALLRTDEVRNGSPDLPPENSKPTTVRFFLELRARTARESH